jgi:two-component system, sensor histidine kinase and response regulator
MAGKLPFTVWRYFSRMTAPIAEQLKVLVVDDDELNRRMMRLILSREEHLVQTASNGFEALDAARSQEFDIILMDLQMPEMDGVETSRQIRANENGGRHAYIVALTASYLPEKGHELFQAGIDNYIAKPFDVEHLRQMLKHGLDHRKSYGGSKVSNPKYDLITDNRGFDPANGIKQIGGNEDVYRELLSDFVGLLPGKVTHLERCFTEKNADGLSRAAHNIKGVASNLGGLQLSDHAGRLEKRAGEGYTPLLEEEIKEFKELSDVFLLEASKFLAGK